MRKFYHKVIIKATPNPLDSTFDSWSTGDDHLVRRTHHHLHHSHPQPPHHSQEKLQYPAAPSWTLHRPHPRQLPMAPQVFLRARVNGPQPPHQVWAHTRTPPRLAPDYNRGQLWPSPQSTRPKRRRIRRPSTRPSHLQDL